jgi:hypothetical protein
LADADLHPGPREAGAEGVAPRQPASGDPVDARRRALSPRQRARGLGARGDDAARLVAYGVQAPLEAPLACAVAERQSGNAESRRDAEPAEQRNDGYVIEPQHGSDDLE